MIRVATEADAPALATTLARAFADDPVACWALPSERRRLDQQRRFFAGRLHTLLPEELVFCDSEHRGAAIWAPPDRWHTPLSELLRIRVVTRRVALVLAGGLRVERGHPKAPHFYLAVLGVDPTAQGGGLGSRLLQPMLERCDREGVPAYLESSKASNVPFYERHGFRVTGEVGMPLGGPTLWRMWREPR